MGYRKEEKNEKGSGEVSTQKEPEEGVPRIHFLLYVKSSLLNV